MNNKSTSNPIYSDSSLIITSIIRLPEFIRFTRWYATPKQFREPENQKQFAEEVGVCEDTLTDWKQNPKFWLFVQRAMSEWMKEHIPDVIGGLYLKTQGDKCSAKDVEMFLRLTGLEIKKGKNK